MPPRTSVDENLVFLYKCFQHSSGNGKVRYIDQIDVAANLPDNVQIDFPALTIATGLNVGAARKRFSRLKDKIESSTAFGASLGPGNTQVLNSKNVNKGNGLHKRKAEAMSDTNAPDLVKSGSNGEEPVAVVSKRQSRGRKLDLSVFDDPEDSQHESLEDSDREYLISAAVKSEVDDDADFESEEGVKSAVKRMKNVVRDKDTPTPTEKMSKHAMKKTVPPKPVMAPKSKAKSGLLPCDEPLSSIESSLPLVPVSGVSSNNQNNAEAASDIDLGSLQPGTLISFPAKNLQQASASMSSALQERDTVVSSQSILTLSATSESTDQDGIHPEDSVFMARSHGVIAPPPGKHTISALQNYIRAFQGSLDTVDSLLTRIGFSGTSA
ncbi:uncharacterized protein Z518_03079 [Rhinocladiella mackenziei CBS 650.93]|uniref:Myb-like DNA-binding domain-containing protein n=1 Tax=Rhinocladiella mackenziei CBS 650.93 TaxID=1442369 RepID=A0A0D2HD68_9EURO|nr:uncharacterized protein Z518_03079 [Rhinocladiella mackenziei CBS 650.93]KIX08423.1 hypothetical protein Z518_03079 [Rhinocladiella mackenziei CBS 650.93]